MIMKFLFIMFYFIMALLFLWTVNLGRDKRHLQWWSPVFALASSIMAVWLYLDIFNYVEGMPNILHLKVQEVFPGSVVPQYNEGVFLVYFNILVLVFYLVVKSILHIPAKIKHWIFKKTKSDHDTLPPPAYRYDKNQKRIFIREEWVYPALFIRYMAWFALLLQTASILWILYAGYPLYGPKLPAVSLLFLCEIAWYLGGVRMSREQAHASEGKKPSKRDLYGNLWHKYMEEEEWKDRVLTASPYLKLSGSVCRTYDEIGLPKEGNDEPALARRNLIRQGFNLDMDQSRIMDVLWKGGDVLISEAIYEKAAPVVFASIQWNVFQGRKIIFLSNSTGNGEIPVELKAWIEKWLDQKIFSIGKYQVTGIKKFRGFENILAASIHDLLKYDMNSFQDWFNQVSAVVIVDIPETIFENIPAASALLQVLDDRSLHKLQLIMLTTEERKNLEPSVREYMTSTPEEFRILPSPESVCHIVWKSEGKPFQSAVLPNSPGYCGTGTALCIPALRRNIERIFLSGANTEPWHEYIEEISKLPDPDCKKAMSVIISSPFPYKPSFEESAFVIARDNDYNLVTTLAKSLAFGRKEVFVHVVCPPYLLREYFADNIDFFLNRRESAGALVPTLIRDPATVAYYLKERLLASELTEAEVLRHINRIEYNPVTGEEAVEDRLVELFREVFGRDLRDRLEVRTKNVLNAGRKRFEKVTMLKLKQGIRQFIPDILSNSYSIYDPGGNLLEIIPKDHIYQNYLPSQVHAFHGELFRIKAIDDHARCIITEHVTPEGSPVYRPVNTLTLKRAEPFHESHVRSTGKNHVITKTLYQADFKVETSEYIVFMNGVDFSEWPETIDLARNNIPPRRYKRGRMLGFEIENLDASKNADQVSYTLSLLLNEIFMTVFPETCQYILSACSYEPGGEKGFAGEIFKLTPKLEYDDKDRCPASGDNTVRIFIFEDSVIDMGLVKALYDNWEYVFMILEDYLAWLREKDGIEKSFLAYGTGSIPEFLRLEQTGGLLTALVGGRPMNIRKSREAFDSRG